MALVTLTQDFASYRSGVYVIENNVWNKGNRVNGVDFTQTVRFDTATVPNGIVFNWNWGIADNSRVLAYPEIIVGHKPWGGASNQSATSRIDQLKNFTVDFDLDIAGSTGDFNVAFEFWLTTRPAGSSVDITTEVMVWVHNGNLVAPGDTGLNYADGGYRGSISVMDDFGNPTTGLTWRYIALAADFDYLNGTLDFHDVLVTLERLGYISPTDYVTGFELGAEVTGGSGGLTINNLSYTFGRHVITEGADTILGGEKRDNLRGRGGDDIVRGNGGNDWIFGDAGSDRLFGNTAADALNGGVGNDHLWGGAGADAHAGGAGIDYARYDDANWGNLIVWLDLPSTNTGAAAGDTYNGIEGLVGGSGNDFIVGSIANNYLFGGAGADNLYGLAGNDYLNGGAGADKFRFVTALNAATNVDRIADFVHGVDDLVLSKAIFARIGAALDASEFRLGTAAADANDYLIYNRTNGQLFYDANGSAVGGQTLFAILRPGTVLDIGDFLMA